MAPINPIRNYDFLVIGGGSGGVACARRAAKYGAKVLLIETKYKKLGGTCVNVGCVPKKVMWYAADLAHKKHHLKAYGLTEETQVTNFGDFAWGAIKEKRDAYVTRLNGIYANNLNREGVDYLYGHARFNEQGNVEVKLTGEQEISFLEKDKVYQKGDSFVFSADKYLITSGGAPIVPPQVPGAELGITSDGFFDLEKQPKSVAVVGAGYIGVELSGIFNSFGSETHFIIRGDTVLRSFDDIIQTTITDHYEQKLGINMHKQSGGVVKVEKGDNGKKIVHLGNGKVLEVDELVWTVGRHSLLDIGLEHVGVDVNHKHQIVVDEYQQTSNPKIFSLGDVVGNFELTPVAIAAGRKLSNRLFGGPQFANEKLEYENIPSAIFSHPEAGSIGLSSTQAINKYGCDNVKVYNSKFTGMYFAMMDSDADKAPTVYRIVCAGPEEKVVGLHLVGDYSAEILQGFGVAIKMGATKKDFDNCVAIHPTSAEELVTMT
ncbi:glutathione reductase [Spathaspora passalidarum NRRL Y-27907]|uniref:Glutathione reductase n=1 Tax=Spathaspora passalidarum (strain NRRL Y-27907 / 11-Y1) TaxID=619300 RepID=G3AP45_SPAPN|nr:glutathione reductase [Spathaspora passalidarum NRRL Y-27907]EGW32076.1 glutathione reductase [Spathaspora passalidarum NRRL Y-27907]